jgi:hypothetical protein
LCKCICLLASRTIALRTFESAYQHEIELASFDLELYSAQDNVGPFPSIFPFSLPLMPDTPQSIQTPHSALANTLTAIIHPVNPLLPSLSKTLTIHTRRYSSHLHFLPALPQVHALDVPTRIEVQTPRTTFTSGEALPLYITIPPPTRETVVEQGLRLRNVRAELVRVVKVKRECLEEEEEDSDSESLSDTTFTFEHDMAQGLSESNVLHTPIPTSSSKAPFSPLFLGSSYRTTIARSGASCRFHSSRPIQLRFVLHQSWSPSPSSESHTNLSVGLYERTNSDADSAMISQETLLHSVSFHLRIHVSFVDTTSHSERISTLIIPVIILPPPAPLPEVSHAVDEAYQKKHDRPPAKTVRREDSDRTVPHYPEGEAGPSMLSAGAPPPFEERDAPPPFFFAEASTSSRLPTFLESENEIILPDVDDNSTNQIPLAQFVPGEGTLFGFHASQQFDGHTEDMRQSFTPPPSLEMANRDTDLTPLTDLSESTHAAFEALNLVLEQTEEGRGEEGEQPPPPPPAMDDPLDPPPSIDSDFRSPVVARQTPPSRSSPPPSRPPYHPTEPPRLHTPTSIAPSESAQSSDEHAPPPYLTPHHDQEHVARPPPYVN